MQRYLTYHAGPTGYGLVRKAESLPLATGKYTHLAMEQLFHHLRIQDTLPGRPEIRAAIQVGQTEYQRAVDERGLAGFTDNAQAQLQLQEQQTLLAGLVWVAARTILPWIHHTYKILEVEKESVYFLGDRQVGQMLRQDVIAEKRETGYLAYFEIKTTGWSNEAWAEQWETKPQLAIGSFGIEERFGKPLLETYIIGLNKGYRKKDDAGIKHQESPLCYGYRRPSNPPLSPEDWCPSYTWVESTGEVRRASRAHKKAPIWEMTQGDWSIYRDAKLTDPTLTPTEIWADFLPQSVREKQVFLVGPLQPQKAQVEALKVQILAEEQHWQEVLWELYQIQQQYPWESAEVQTAIQRLIPASWNCRPYGKDSQCEFIHHCFRLPGWEDLLATGKYVPRRPHHQPELEQAIARGLLPAEGLEAEEEE